ncbi:MAG: class I SAM-dependent methyltransferase [Lentisphaerae bacterium]|jgi:demethylmenaquinone methyltransferase/2-methoxy-6-polyprenyl-1,4-benzoquinol methylase|nr:class I SAM-dependent methyltransferase [Lentisphaerota bacterium]
MERAEFFDRLATELDPLAILPEHESRMERLRERLGDLRGKRVLEPGCGAGALSRRLAEWVGRGGRVLAWDPSEGMVAHCRRVVQDFAQVEVAQGTAEEIVIGAGEWDLALCFRVYPHLEKPELFLGRCGDWLVPGGELVVANLEGSESLNAMHAELPGVREDRMPAAEALAALLRELGWQVVAAIDEPEEYYVRARRP